MKHIVKFYKKNKWISILGVISLLISLSYAFTYNMPDYFGIAQYYSLLNNICISYIAAVIFYIVQVYISEERQQKKCIVLLKSKIEDLIKFNEVAILMCEKHIIIADKGATINWNGDEERIYLKSKSNDASKGPHLARYDKTELLNWKKVFDDKIKGIKETTIINYCDYEILELILELEKCDFYSGLKTVIKYADSDIDTRSFNDNITKFKRINTELKRTFSISEYYQLTDVSKEEIVQIDIIYKQLENNTLNIQAVNRAIMGSLED